MARNGLRWGGAVLLVAATAGCGSQSESDVFDAGRGGGDGSAALGATGSSLGGSGGTLSSGSLSGGNLDSDAATVGDPNCPDGGTTTISGTIYDPAMQDPLYNITAFVPLASAPLPTLPSGASCASCADLYPTNIVASAGTDTKGHFTIFKSPTGPAIPAGQNIPIVVQTGKWRMQSTIANVTACQDNVVPDKSLHLPRNGSEGDLPDIAISTGGADSLECLPLRIGVDPTEYVPGGVGPGHIHIFQGTNGASTVPAAPVSSQALWNSTADLMKNDVVLLSCEGAETAGVTTASRQSLSDYAGAGGRVFASHFHYSWFNQAPFAADNLATWTTGGQTLNDNMSFPGDVVTTLNAGGPGPFPEGVALGEWLAAVNALTNSQLEIWFSRHNADVGPGNIVSQPWIVLDPASPLAPGATQYFSFDTPVGAAGAEKCGRVVYSDLHVSGGPAKNQPNVLPDYPNAGGNGGRGRAGSNVVPTQCASHPLTPQEKALEFMLFDLSSCLIPVGSPTPLPPTPVPR